MLELKKICFELEDGGEKRQILTDLSLKVGDGELVVITGPNGGGKSCLAEIIMGVKKPTSGEIFFDGKDITKMPINERAGLGIGLSFQQPTKLKGVTVAELLNIASNKEDNSCYLKMVGLESDKYRDREVGDGLSGGEAKRIEIASVLAREAKLMVFDEPEAGIDLWSFDNLLELFKRMRIKCSTKSLIIVSHQEKIIKLADRLVILDAGKIQKVAKPDKIIAGGW